MPLVDRHIAGRSARPLLWMRRRADGRWSRWKSTGRPVQLYTHDGANMAQNCQKAADAYREARQLGGDVQFRVMRRREIYWTEPARDSADRILAGTGTFGTR